MSNIQRTRLSYLQTAKELTGSTDIDFLIATAKKIELFAAGVNAAEKADPASFAEFSRKLSIIHPHRGAIPLALYDFQHDLVRTIQDNQFVVVCSSRQMGMTTVLAAYALWLAAHNGNRKIAIFGTKLHSCMEFIERIEYMIQRGSAMLPAVITNHRTEIAFNNGSRIVGRTVASKEHDDDYTDIILTDAAWISHSAERSFWMAMTPMLSNGATCVIQSSAHITDGLFWQLWSKAPQNGFVPVEIKWDAHPDRDEQWADAYRQQLGDKRFEAEFNCKFITPDKPTD